MRTNWSGIFVVSVTPFKETGELDENAFRELVRLFIGEGVDGIVLAGSTGEWFTMSDAERIELFRIAKDEAGSKLPLLAGISALSTASSVELATKAKEIGLDGALLLPPPYILPTDRELDSYIASIAEIDLPIMLYNNPPRTGINLDGRWLKKLTRHKSIVALKESSKDIHQLSATIDEFGDELAIFTGMETYVSPTLLRGGAGVVAMAPNVFGARAVEFYCAVRDGDYALASALQKPIDRLYRRMYSGNYNPYVVLKEGMRLLGRPGGHPRLPLLPFAEEDRKEFADFLREI